MDVIQISTGDILLDILEVSSKWLPQSILWLGRRKRCLRCLHDHCTTENGSDGLSFDCQEPEEHLQQHHLRQHSGHCSKDRGTQLTSCPNPTTVPDTVISFVPVDSQQDQAATRSTIQPPGRTHGSVSSESHVLDICFPMREIPELHYLDELMLESGLNVPVLLGQLKMKFQNKQNHARLLPGRSFYLKRLQWIEINRVCENCLLSILPTNG